MYNLTISSLLLVNLARSPLLADKRTHVDIHKSIFRFQQAHIIYKLKSFQVFNSKFRNCLSSVIEQEQLNTGCPRDSSIHDCEFVGGSISSGSFVSMNSGYVNRSVFYGITGRDSATSVVSFSLFNTAGNKGSLDTVCFSSCSGFTNGVTGSSGLVANQEITSCFVNYYLISDMDRIINDRTPLSQSRYNNLNISSSVYQGTSNSAIFFTYDISSTNTYKYFDIRNNTITNYFLSTQSLPNFAFSFENSQFLMMKFTTQQQAFISTDYVIITLSHCYFDADSFTKGTSIIPLNFANDPRGHYDFDNCIFDMAYQGSQLSIQLNFYRDKDFFVQLILQ